MIDWQAVGAAVGGLLLGGVSALTWWNRRTVRNARDSADVAGAGADRTVADAQHTLYAMLVARLGTLEEEMKTLRRELNAERERSRELETHIYRLENLMRRAGMDPPARTQMLG